jgi:TPP-dependent pyruvate/acetoin dehydrogenase alpha subunit
VEIETFRFLEHCGPNDDTKLGYRTLKELNNWKKKDPLIFAKNYLVKKNIFKKEKLDSLDKNIFKNVNVDFSHMLNLKKPKFNRIKNLVYKK